MKRFIALFLIFWAIVFALSFFTTTAEWSVMQRAGYTAALALCAPLVDLFGGNGHRRTKKTEHSSYVICDVEIHLPLDPKVLYYIKDGKVYKGMSASPTYEIKGNMVYPYLSPKPVFRIENGKVYRGMEPAPFLDIRGGEIYHSLSSRVAYEIKFQKQCSKYR